MKIGSKTRSLECLGEVARRYRVSIHAYVLMTHPVHRLMMPTSAAGTRRVLQTLGRRYVRYINPAYRQSGTLWEGRYPAAWYRATAPKAD
jgi:REP-associated tyrosine transposase